MAGVSAEKTCLGKEATRLDSEIAKATARLGIEAIVAKAPSAVIDQEKKRVDESAIAMAKSCGQMTRLG